MITPLLYTNHPNYKSARPGCEFQVYFLITPVLALIDFPSVCLYYILYISTSLVFVVLSVCCYLLFSGGWLFTPMYSTDKSCNVYNSLTRRHTPINIILLYYNYRSLINSTCFITGEFCTRMSVHQSSIILSSAAHYISTFG